MKPMIDIELPDSLENYRENIEATIKPYIEIKAQENNNIPYWQSKFGGIPYFPKEHEYPTDSQGKPMYLLAQINFAETPKLEGFPEKGLLQFYISGNDMYGMSFDDQCKQEDFRILYFPDVIEDESHLVTDFDYLPKPEDYFPIEKQSSLTFILKQAPLSVNDYQFEAKILNIDPELKHELFSTYQDVYDEYGDTFRSEGHKIGGYPYFTQYDPRGLKKNQGEEKILLLQIDSDEKRAGIMWGDVGVANFFIAEKDLKNLDFSNVLYNWDCC